MKKLNEKEKLDQYLDNNQEQAKAQIYKSKSVQSVLRFIVLAFLLFDAILFLASIIYYDIGIFAIIAMLAIIVFQTMFWLCFLKEHCFYYFPKAIANYYYQGVLWAIYLFSETLFMDICPVYF